MNLFRIISKLFCSRQPKRTDFPSEKLAKILGYKPKKWEIYRLALIAKSAEMRDAEGHHINNERLEFLGDAVLETIVSDMLFHRFPNAAEGQLTMLRSRMVKRETLNVLCERIGMAGIIRGKKGKNMHNIFGNAVEALIGAVYIDRGYVACQTFVEQQLYGKGIKLEKLLAIEENYKSRLLEWAQKQRKVVVFDVFDETSNEKKGVTRFFAKVYVDGVEYGSGTAAAKRKAEQAASKQALRLIEIENSR